MLSCEDHHRDVEKAHAWMRRIKAMLKRDDMTGVFTYAHVHGFALSPDTAKEVAEVWKEWAELLGYRREDVKK